MTSSISCSRMSRSSSDSGSTGMPSGYNEPASADGYVRDLRRSEGDDGDVRAIAVEEVEVVEVTAGGAGDQHAGPRHEWSLCNDAGRQHLAENLPHAAGHRLHLQRRAG